MALREPIVRGSVKLLASRKIVVGIAAQQTRRIGRLGGRLCAVGHRCGGLRIVGWLGVGGLEVQQVANLGRGLASAQKERTDQRRHKYTTPTHTHTHTPRAVQPYTETGKRSPDRRPKKAGCATLGYDG